MASTELSSLSEKQMEESVQQPSGTVDLRMLRLQMERSLAKLQAGDLGTSPPAKPIASNIETATSLCLSAAVVVVPKPAQDWAHQATEHCQRRLERKLARISLWEWRQLTECELRAVLQQHVSELHHALNEAEMQLSEHLHPERIQVQPHASA